MLQSVGTNASETEVYPQKKRDKDQWSAILLILKMEKQSRIWSGALLHNYGIFMQCSAAEGILFLVRCTMHK